MTTTTTDISKVHKLALLGDLWNNAFQNFSNPERFDVKKAKAALNKGYIDFLCSRRLRVDLTGDTVDFSAYDDGVPDWSGAKIVKHMLELQKKGQAGSTIMRNDILDFDDSVIAFYHGKKAKKKRKRDQKPSTKDAKTNKKPKIIWVKSDCNGELVGRPKGLPEGYEVRLVDDDADKKNLIDLLFYFMELHVEITNTERYLLLLELSNYTRLGGGYENGTIPIEFDDEEIGMFICNHFSEEQLVEYMTATLKDMKSNNQIKDATVLTKALNAYIEEDDKALPSRAFLMTNMQRQWYFIHSL